MDERESTQWAFISLLVGGLLILTGGVAMTTMMVGMGPWMGTMMGGYGYTTPAWSAWAGWMLAISALSGALVLYAAARVRGGPDARRQAGVLGIVGGAVSLLAMGGWLVGAIAAIVGGALALASPPQQARA